jgi:molybdopterin synthase sulfur carrier subunit
MTTVRFTKALKRFFPSLKETETTGKTLTEILNEMDDHYPGVRSYLVDEQGALRKHVNIFINGKIITDRTRLSDSFSENSEIYIIQALSGG